MSAWPSIQLSRFCSPLAFSSCEPFLSSNRPTGQKRSGEYSHRENDLMHMMTATFVLLVGVGSTLTGAASMNGVGEDWKPQAGDSDSSVGFSLPEEPVHGSNAGQTVAEMDCDERTPTTKRITTRPSRMVRSASPMRGVQCPIPLVPKQAAIEENNR